MDITTSDRYCYILKSRGFGDKLFKIVKHGEELELKAVDGSSRTFKGGTFRMYKVHCYSDVELRKRSMREKQETGDQVGKRK